MTSEGGSSNASTAGAGRPRREAGENASLLDGLEGLRLEAEDLRRRFAVSSDPAQRFHGQDSAGAIQVTLGGDGRVADVDLDRGWREAVGVDGLAASVLEAITDASMRRLAAWGEKVASRGRGPTAGDTNADDERGDAGPERRAAAPSDSAESRQAVQELVSMLEGVEDALDDLERRIGQRLQQQVVGRSPSNMVTVTMTGDGQVKGIDINRRLLERTPEQRIAQELRSSFQAAYARADKLGIDALLGDGRLGALYTLGRDPTALLRRLGLDAG